MPDKTSAIAAYIPVIHRGYLEFFSRYPDARTLYVFGQSVLDTEDYLRKDLRALTPEQQVQVVGGMAIFDQVELLEVPDLSHLADKHSRIILPDEDVSRTVAQSWPENMYELSPVFLRWDRQSADAKQEGTTEQITAAELDQTFMRQALEKVGQSSDIWRRVGAVLVARDAEPVALVNKGEPSEHSPWMEGDPRNIFNRGVGIEMSVFTHAEAGLIAEAARRGVKLDGAKLYVSTFPCPACAKLIAHSGVKTCYYKDGYAVLDGKRVLEDYGVQLVRVQMPDDSETKGPEWVPYKK